MAPTSASLTCPRCSTSFNAKRSAAGFDDGQVVEVLAHVALNLFTNYVNVAFAVPVDFPGVKLRSAT
jgi:alkylhydroperoxidase family enzyme